MKVVKSALKGEEHVFTGAYSECVDFCKDGGFIYLDTFTFKGIVLQEKWYNAENNTVYSIA